MIWVDPEAARRRKEAAQKQARVELWREAAGTCTLAGRDLPPGLALAADKHLTAAARLLKDHGADGTLGQLRAQAFLSLLSGQPVPGGQPVITPVPGGDSTSREASGAADRAPAPGTPGQGQASGEDADGGEDGDGGGDGGGGRVPALAGTVT